jgi:hypothetical protein
MTGEVLEPQRNWVAHEETEDSLPGGEGTDASRCGLIDADVDKVINPAVRAKDAERTIGRIHKVNGRRHDATQGGPELKSRRNRDHSGHESAVALLHHAPIFAHTDGQWEGVTGALSTSLPG